MLGCFYTQTEYSLQNNVTKINLLIKKAKEAGYAFLSITDNNMYGAYKFYKQCKENGIKPIIGLEVLFDGITLKKNKILLYAFNQEGYLNLLKINSLIAQGNNVGLEELKALNEGIFAITCFQNEIVTSLLANNFDKALSIVDEYKKSFKDLYLGYSLNELQQIDIKDDLYLLASKTKIRLLPLWQNFYLNEDDVNTYLYVKAIKDNKIFGDVNHLSENHFPSSLKEFGDYKDIFDNVDEVIKRVDLVFTKALNPMPHYKTPSNLLSQEYLKALCITGLKKRLRMNKIKDSITYMRRLEYELDIIEKMHYEDYFLIVYDFIYYAKKNSILVGPGRGSSAGCLVSYCLGITNVDPIKYGLLFERFLNPERVTMPDIDLDFPDDKRDDVIRYVAEKYGSEHVANIVTFDTYQIRSALRDVLKAKGVNEPTIKAIAEVISDGFTYDELKNALDKDLSVEYKVINDIIDLPKYIGTHASGVILSDSPLYTYTFLGNGPIKGNNGYIFQTGYEASDLEDLGLLKIDFLSLRNLTIIENIVSDINKDSKEPFNPFDIEFEDKATYDLLSRGDTLGVFQLEKPGMRRVLRKLQPTSFLDLVAILSLYRPGPMDYIDTYIERKKGKEFSYPHDSLKEILSETYGIIVYQEQIMLLAAKFASYSLGEADVLRRAIAKKKTEALAEGRKTFVEKAERNGHTVEISNRIYDDIVKFANYGFNKSHAVAYGMIVYAMAFIKANYPAYFIKGMLNSGMGKEKDIELISNASKKGIKILPPDINKSFEDFSIENKAIRYSLADIKNVGKELAKKIVLERENGNFISFRDFKKRMMIKGKSLEALVRANAFSSFKETIFSMLLNLESTFANSDFEKDVLKECSLDELISQEREILGMNISFNPFLPYKKMIEEKKIIEISDINNGLVGKRIFTIAFIKNCNRIFTKKEQTMATLLLTNGIIDIEAVLFPDHFTEKSFARIKEASMKKEIVKFFVEIAFRQNALNVIVLDVIYLKED